MRRGWGARMKGFTEANACVRVRVCGSECLHLHRVYVEGVQDGRMHAR